MPRTATRPLLVFGDFALLILAVPATLLIRYLGIPSAALLMAHLESFSLLALLFIAVFFSAGLYDPVTTIMRRELPGTIFWAQVVNIIIAALFFFFVPVFGITPKTNLIIYLLVSVPILSIWHLVVPRFQKEKGTAIMIGDGPDVAEVLHECQSGSNSFRVVQHIPIAAASALEIEHALAAARPDFLIVDLGDDRVQPALSVAAHTPVVLVDFSDVYEEFFRRLPLSTLSHQWLLSNSRPERVVYDIAKRAFDIAWGSVLSLALGCLIPFIWVAVRLEGGGPLFISQKRMGREGSTITVLKFRSMRHNKSSSSEWTVEEKVHNPVTAVGAFLRKTSLDELPQVISVFKGELSLIGPRSDIAGLAERLAEAIPYYMLRYSVTPGISGWAQVNQRYSPGNISPQSIEESRIRLAYDLYYVKHRSFLLDISILFRTLKTLMSRWVA